MTKGGDVDADARRPSPDDELPDTALFWRWVAKATRPVIGWILVGLGAIFVLAGYLGVSREAIVAKQLPYLLSGGIGGMVLIAVGAFLLGTEDLRKDLQRLERLETMVGELHGVLLTRAGSIEPAESMNGNGRAARRPAGDVLVALPRGKSFHRPGCAMVDGKDAGRVSEGEVRDRGLEPCSLCEPAPAPA
jgi:hypothetical protein